MIASQNQGSKIKFAFLGTHKDQADKCEESQDMKNSRLKEMVDSFGLQESVIVRDHNTFIFAVNAKYPEDIDHQTIGHLREHILTECPSHIISIPVSYHALELTLKKKVLETGRIVFTEGSILEDLPNCNFTKESLRSALRYLHKNNCIFY